MSGATQEPRTAVMILVEASWLDNSGALRSEQARMENRSAHGACIRMKARVEVGKRVYIQSHREQFSGIAKYCRVDGKEFLVGIEKDAVSWPMPKGPIPGNGPNQESRRMKDVETNAERPERVGFSRADVLPWSLHSELANCASSPVGMTERGENKPALLRRTQTARTLENHESAAPGVGIRNQPQNLGKPQSALNRHNSETLN